ncbi:MAG: putative transposase [Thermosediminibacterales bacterium]|nr:putative transposase [Thermosediminibacterales bacterium]MDK2835691.1 putative transposase [Thermosediminibacterales bacterium]
MKTYCFKLYQSKRNRMLHKSIDIAGRIYNHLIALHKRYYRLYGKHLNVNKLMKHITKLKKQKRFAYWKLLGSQAIQDIAQRIDRSYKLFFENRRRNIKSAPPSFKKIKKYKSFTLKQAGYKLLDGNRIVIMGNVYKYFKSRDIEGKVKTLTVKRDSLEDIYIYLTCETEEAVVESRSGKSVGLDFGLKKFLTASDGKIIESPLFFKQGMKEIRKLNKSLSRKKKGSNNYKRALLALARAYKKITNQRRDYYFKLAKKLAEEYAMICIEDLNIKAMQRLWGRKVSDLGHSQFVNILKYQCAKTGTTVVEIPRFYPSSKTCSDCGYVLDDLPLNTRVWICPECGSIHNRDLNAAINILRVGTSTLVGEGVRPISVGVLR